MWIMSNTLALVVISVIMCRADGQDDPVLTCETYKGCLPPSICDDKGGFISCLCPEGKSGPNCEFDDPCVKRIDKCGIGQLCYGTCKPNFLCTGVTGVQMCLGCIAGWEGDDCLKDVDECTDPMDPDVCNKGTCTNTIGGFECTCKKGWTGTQCHQREKSVKRKTTDIKDLKKSNIQLENEVFTKQLVLLDEQILKIDKETLKTDLEIKMLQLKQEDMLHEMRQKGSRSRNSGHFQ